MATTATQGAGQGANKVQFDALGDDDDWESVDGGIDKAHTTTPAVDTIGPAPDITQSWLYTGGDDTASTVKDLRGLPEEQQPAPEDDARRAQTAPLVAPAAVSPPSHSAYVPPPAPLAVAVVMPPQGGRVSPVAGKDKYPCFKALTECFSFVSKKFCGEDKKTN